MATIIGGTLYPVSIPDYTDPADIQTTLKLFHFGSTTIPTLGADIVGGVAKHLYDLNIAKAPLASPTFTGTVTLPDNTVTNAMLAGSIADSKLSTLTTGGKVANSATTATSANTNSAIVARDSSGNFSAGTVTANLTGNVTGNIVGKVTQSSGVAYGKIYVQATEPVGAATGDLWFW